MRSILLPDTIRLALEAGASIAASISGGKDSQALLKALKKAHREHRWPGRIFAIHADLGRAEWEQTPGHVVKISQDEDVPLVVVRRAKGDMVARWEERMKLLEGTGKPFWSSAANRYCTSDLKRAPINAYLRRFPFVISAEGIRAEESPSRAKKPIFSLREMISAVAYQRMKDPLRALEQHLYRPLGRLAFTWNPILDWKLEDVWEAGGTSCQEVDERRTLYRVGLTTAALDAWPEHPAYVFGNERLSCALCVLASHNDLRVGANHNRWLYDKLLSMEVESGFTFRQDIALADLPIYNPEEMTA